MDKSDKYWSCSDKESLCLKGDSNLFHLQAYFLCLQRYYRWPSLHMATHMNGNLLCKLSSSWQFEIEILLTKDVKRSE